MSTGPVNRLTEEPEAALVSALADAESYRALALAAIGRLHQLTREHDALRERYCEALNENRRRREQKAA